MLKKTGHAMLAVFGAASLFGAGAMIQPKKVLAQNCGPECESWDNYGDRCPDPGNGQAFYDCANNCCDQEASNYFFGCVSANSSVCLGYYYSCQSSHTEPYCYEELKGCDALFNVPSCYSQANGQFNDCMSYAGSLYERDGVWIDGFCFTGS
jgi:hypothetical protein